MQEEVVPEHHRANCECLGNVGHERKRDCGQEVNPDCDEERRKDDVEDIGQRIRNREARRLTRRLAFPIAEGEVFVDEEDDATGDERRKNIRDARIDVKHPDNKVEQGKIHDCAESAGNRKFPKTLEMSFERMFAEKMHHTSAGVRFHAS